MILFAVLILAASLGIGISHSQTDSIPSWVKSVAGFWAEDKINDKEFVEALEFLISEDIIHTNNQEMAELQAENNHLKQEIENLKQDIDELKEINDSKYGDTRQSVQTSSEESKILPPAFKTVIIEETKFITTDEYDGELTLHKIEFAKEHTRMLVSVENTGDERLRFDWSATKILQKPDQFRFAQFSHPDIDKIDLFIFPEIIEKGYIFIEPINPGPLTIIMGDAYLGVEFEIDEGYSASDVGT